VQAVVRAETRFGTLQGSAGDAFAQQQRKNLAA
jgi:hypothetical protein